MTLLKLKSIVLPVLVASLLLVACGTDESVKARYESERLFFEAEKLAEEARIKPGLGTGQNRDQIYLAYQEALDFTLASIPIVDSKQNTREFAELSLLAHRSATRLTKMHFTDHNFDTCIALMNSLLENVSLGREEKIATYYNLAQALQSDGQFDSAITIYSHTINTFNPPITRDGHPIVEILNLPLFLGRIFTQLGDSTQAIESFDNAETYYLGLIESAPGSSLAMMANRNLARLYYDIGRWDESIAYLNELIDSTGQVPLSARFRIADIQSTFQKRYSAANASLDQILKSLHGRDTILIPVVWFKKSLIKLERGQNTEAREMIAKIQKDFPKYDRANPRVQYMKARSFDLENNWDRAESEYKYLIEKHGESREALATYLYLASQLSDRGRTTEADSWYAQADQQYTLLAARGTGTIKEAIALTYRADLYRSQNRWKDAASTLTMVYTKFPASRIGRKSLLTAANIYQQKLDDPITADSLKLELEKNLPANSSKWDS